MSPFIEFLLSHFVSFSLSLPPPPPLSLGVYVSVSLPVCCLSHFSSDEPCFLSFFSRARPRKPEQQLYVPRGRRGLGQPVLHRGPGITSASQSEPALSRPQLEPSQVDDVACLEHSPAELAGNVPRRESPHFGGSQSKTRSVHREKRAARCQEEKSSEKPGTGSAKAPGSKRSRPEVQLYVPRGRRQHEEQSESSALKGSRRASSSPYTDGEASLAETIDGSCEREQSSVPDSGWTAEPHNLETEESQGQTFESQIGVPMDSEVNVHKDIANTPLHPSFEQSSALGEYSQEVTSSMEHLSDSVGVPPTLTGISADPSITAQCRLESNAEDSSANVVVPLTLDSMSTESSIREQHQHQCSVEELSHDVEVRKLDRESTEYTSSLEQCESPMKGVSNNVEEVHKPESESTDHPSCLEQYQHENSMQDVVTPSTLQNTSAQDSMVTEHQQQESSVEGLSKSSESAVEPPTVESRSHEHPCSLEQHQQGGETSTMSNVTDEGVVQSALHAISDKTQNTLFSGQCEPPVNMDMGDAGARDACDGHSGLMSVVSDFDHSDSAAAANVVELLADVDAEFLPSRGEPVFQDLALTGCMENREELSETCTQEMSPVSKTERPVEEILGTVSVGETRAGEMCPMLPSCGSVDQTKESQSSISDDQGHNGVDHVAKDSTPVCKDVEGSCVAKDSTPVCKDVQESCVAKDSTPVCQDAEESCVAKGSTPVCQDVEESCVAKDSTPVCQDVEESCVAKDSTPVCQDVEESCVAKDSTPVCQDAEESGVAKDSTPVCQDAEESGVAKDSTPVCQDAEESCVAKDSTPVCLDVEERTHKSVTTERDDCSDISANPEALSQSQAQLDSAKTQQDLPSMSSDLQKKADFNDLLPNDIKSSEKQMADPEVAHAASKPSDSGDGFQAGAAQTSQEDEEEEEDSWDKIFDDNGDCLDPSMIEEVKP